MDDLYKYKYEPCNIVIYGRNNEVLLEETSLVAYNKDTKKILAFGNDAKLLLDSSDDNIVVMSPLKNGFVANFMEAQSMFKYFVNKVYKINFFSSPSIILCTPPEPTEVEQRAYTEAIAMIGAKQVYITAESIDKIMLADKNDYNIIIDIVI